MKVKFRYGIKNYSGKLDELVYASYDSRNVVIGRMLPRFSELTPQNIAIKTNANIIAEFYRAVSDAFKQDLELYTMKLYKTKAYRDRIAGNKYSTFNKLIYASTKDASNPLDITSLSTDDLSMGVYSQLENVKTCVENGYLPEVDGYEELTASIHD